MRAIVICVAFGASLLASCGEVRVAEDAGIQGDAPGGDDSCSGASDCEEPTPHCHPDTGECVECVDENDCETGACDSDTHTCEGCTTNDECASADASLCDDSTNTCVACEQDEHCAHFGDDHLCEAGTCTECQFEAVSTAVGHTCGLREGGSLWCWGRGSDGQLGHGDDPDEPIPEPTLVAGGGEWRSVATGRQGTFQGPPWSCGLRDDDSLWCWGGVLNGRLANGVLEGEPVLEPTMSDDRTWRELAFGSEHACALGDDDAVYCWGMDNAGQLGQGENDESLATPTQVDTSPNWTRIDAGALASCGLRGDGELWCWGSNFESKFGLGEDADSSFDEPQQVEGDDWADVSVGGAHSCGIKQDGTLYCWGRGTRGRLGLGEDADNPTHEPEQVGEHSDWVAVVAGSQHTCGLRLGGSLWCWGFHNDGRLGLGDLDDDVFEPQEVTEPQGEWLSLSLWSSNTCAIRDGGELWCWGRNDDGRLGLGETSEEPVTEPAQVECPIRD